MSRSHSRHLESGIAIALVLWMLAAMSLTVSAAVHFARGDTAMADLHRESAQAYWLGRGLSRVVLQEHAMSMQVNALEGTNLDAAENETADLNVVFTREYNVDGISVKASVHPANGFLSLNSASVDEMAQFFQQVGKMPTEDARLVAAGVDDLRSYTSVASFDTLENPGLRYVEELLSVPGMNRTAYDRLRPYMHTLPTTGFKAGAAPGEIRSEVLVQESEGIEPSTERLAGANQLMTFEKLAQQRGRAAMGTESSVVVLETQFESGARYRQLVILRNDQAPFDRVGKVDRVSRDY